MTKEKKHAQSSGNIQDHAISWEKFNPKELLGRVVTVREGNQIVHRIIEWAEIKTLNKVESLIISSSLAFLEAMAGKKSRAICSDLVIPCSYSIFLGSDYLYLMKDPDQSMEYIVVHPLAHKLLTTMPDFVPKTEQEFKLLVEELFFVKTTEVIEQLGTDEEEDDPGAAMARQYINTAMEKYLREVSKDGEPEEYPDCQTLTETIRKIVDNLDITG